MISIFTLKYIQLTVADDENNQSKIKENIKRKFKKRKRKITPPNQY